MKPPPFEYVAPDSVDEALEALASTEDSRVLAGGQSLVPLMNLRLARPALLVDCNRVRDLAAFSVHNGTARVGAFCRHRLPYSFVRALLVEEATGSADHLVFRERIQAEGDGRL